MASISKCPKCGQQVTIPDVAAQTQVRCPLCQAEYPLSEALAAMPPALIPVGLAAGALLPGEPAATGSTALLAETPPTEAAPPAGEQAAVTPEKPLPAAIEQEPAAVPAGELSVPEATQAAAAAGVEQKEIEQKAIEPERAIIDTAVFAALRTEEPAEEEAAAAVPGRRRPRRRPKEKGALRQVIEVVGGGFFGLFLAYYFLNLIGGERFDFAKVYLPFVGHARQGWPFSKTEDTGNTAPEQLPAKTPEKTTPPEEPALKPFPQPKSTGEDKPKPPEGKPTAKPGAKPKEPATGPPKKPKPEPPQQPAAPPPKP